MPRIIDFKEDIASFVNRFAGPRLCNCGGKVTCLISREDMEIWQCDKCLAIFRTKEFFELDVYPAL